MRLWSRHPDLLDRAARVAGWREGLLAQAVLAGRTKGYRSHPQLDRFRAADDPLRAVATYLWSLRAEATERGYRFDAGRLDCPPDDALRLAAPVVSAIAALVRARSPEWESRLTAPAPHPLFDVVDGPLEPWERPGAPVPAGN